MGFITAAVTTEDGAQLRVAAGVKRNGAPQVVGDAALVAWIESGIRFGAEVPSGPMPSPLRPVDYDDAATLQSWIGRFPGLEAVAFTGGVEYPPSTGCIPDEPTGTQAP